jgi:cysteinyl-tRNA synthetase
LKLRKDFKALQFNVDEDVNIFAKEVEMGEEMTYFRNQFVAAIEEDLNLPVALSVMWTSLKSETLKDWEKRRLVKNFDKILGLYLGGDFEKKTEIPEEILELMKKREEVRKSKNWAESDALRDQIQSLGYKVSDFADGVSIEKI